MIGVFWAAFLIGGSLPVPASAQLGPIIDRIQKMSGPRMVYYGPVYRWGYQPGQQVDGDRDEPAERERAVALEWAGGPAIDALDPGYRSAAAACARSAADLIRAMGDGFFDEESIDRARANRERLERLGRRLRDPSPDDPAGGDLSRQFRDVACMQPNLLGLATPDPMGGWVWRIGVQHGRDIGNDRPAGVDVFGLAGQLSVEYLAAWPMRQWINFGLEAGVAGHYFHGDFDEFIHPTFFAKINVHPFTRCSGWVWRNFRAGINAHLVPPFGSDAFGGIYPLENGWEATRPDFFVAVDISRESLSGNDPFDC